MSKGPQVPQRRGVIRRLKSIVDHKLPGIQVAQYEPTAIDRCNFGIHRKDMDAQSSEPAVTALIVTDTDGHGTLLRLCRRHLCRLSIRLIDELG